jgi:hypothetical protein
MKTGNKNLDWKWERDWKQERERHLPSKILGNAWGVQLVDNRQN